MPQRADNAELRNWVSAHPGVRYVDWPVDDPKGQDEATVRRVIADIDRRVRRLLAELVPDRELPPSVFERVPEG